MIMYKTEEIDKFYNEFKVRYDFDILNKSRVPEKAHTRALFFKVLNKIYKLKDVEIASWCLTKGSKRNRSSIFQAMAKTDNYYEHSFSFRNMYDDFFEDKKELRLQAEKKPNKYTKWLHRRERNKTNKINNISEMLKDLSADRVQDIKEMIELKIKSYEWKSKDTCKVYDCSEHLETF